MQAAKTAPHRFPLPVRRVVQMAGAALLVLAMGAQAAGLPGVVNTGVDSAGALLTLGATDPSWTVTGPNLAGATPAAVLINQHPVGQYYTSADSLWIWANAAGSATVGSPYTFTLSFDLTGYDPSKVSLSGYWGADNYGNVLLNGAAPVGSGTFQLTGINFANFNTQNTFNITGGFVAGVNTLQFQVTDGGNPAGLDVGGLVAAVPEPSTASMLLAGLALCLATVWRRRSLTHG